MRCYEVRAPGAKRYAGTNAEARATRQQLVDETGCKKKDVEIEQVEIAVDKASLLDHFNELLEQLDGANT